MTGPCDLNDGRAVIGTVHATCRADQLARRVADIDVPPPALAATLVIERRLHPAPPTAAPTADLGPHQHLHQRPPALGLHQRPTQDHRGAAQPQRRNEYLLEPHAADPPFESDHKTARNLG